MFKIAICDDEESTISRVEQIINSYQLKTNVALTIRLFLSAKQLLAHIESGERFDIIFLDIGMEGLNGIEFGHILRDQINDEQTKIIYISWNKAYSMDLHSIRPFDFLLKPVKIETVEKVLDKVIEVIMRDESFFFFKSDGKLIKLPQKDILYFQSFGRKINILTSRGNYMIYDKLEDIIKQLDERYFWRVHKSYLINSLRVKVFEYHCLIMDNGEQITVSQPNRPKVRELQRNIISKEV